MTASGGSQGSLLDQSDVSSAHLTDLDTEEDASDIGEEQGLLKGASTSATSSSKTTAAGKKNKAILDPLSLSNYARNKKGTGASSSSSSSSSLLAGGNVALILLLVITGSATAGYMLWSSSRSCPGSARRATSHARAVPYQNVILAISDGFGPASQTFGREFYKALHGIPPIQTYVSPLDDIQVGNSRTLSATSLVTDSAAGATAFSCVQKTYNGAIGGNTLLSTFPFSNMSIEEKARMCSESGWPTMWHDHGSGAPGRLQNRFGRHLAHHARHPGVLFIARCSPGLRGGDRGPADGPVLARAAGRSDVWRWPMLL